MRGGGKTACTRGHTDSSILLQRDRPGLGLYTCSSHIWVIAHQQRDAGIERTRHPAVLPTVPTVRRDVVLRVTNFLLCKRILGIGKYEISCLEKGLDVRTPGWDRKEGQSESGRGIEGIGEKDIKLI